MESVTVNFLHHILGEGLYKLEINEYQDKKGCSLCGFKDYSFSEEGGCGISLHDSINEYFDITDVVKDYRGCPVYFKAEFGIRRVFPDVMLGMKNVCIDMGFERYPNICEEEKGPVKRHVKKEIKGLGLGNDWRERNHKWGRFGELGGHVFSVDAKHMYQLKKSFIPFLSNFPHLRMLSIELSTDILTKSKPKQFSELSNLVYLDVDGLWIPEAKGVRDSLSLFTKLQIFKTKACYSSFISFHSLN